MAMTPRARSAALSEESLTSAPRSLNELVTWRFSYLTKTSAPVSADRRGAGSIGVRNTLPAIARRASFISAMVTFTFPLQPLPGFISALCRSLPPWASRASHLAPCGPSGYDPSQAGEGRKGPGGNAHVHGRQAARLRSRPPPGTVRGRAGAPGDRLLHRFYHSRYPGGAGGDAYVRFHHRHAGAWRDPVLVALPGFGGLGAGLFRPDAGRPALGHRRYAGDGPRNAHLVRYAGLFHPGRGACGGVLVHRVVFHALRAAGGLFQPPEPPAARHSAWNGDY